MRVCDKILEANKKRKNEVKHCRNICKRDTFWIYFTTDLIRIIDDDFFFLENQTTDLKANGMGAKIYRNYGHLGKNCDCKW